MMSSIKHVLRHFRSTSKFFVLLAFLFPTVEALAGSWSTENTGGMSVQLYTPTTSPARNNKRALMINLHGCAQTASELRTGGNWKATADKYGMVVAIPDAPNGGVIAGCWDYYDSQSRNGKHVDNLISLANTLKNRSSLNIDSNQVYISGLSSGGAQSFVMGCIAPDIFAGIGINAGPAVGTSSSQISNCSSTSVNTASNTCNNFAGSRSSHFSTQIASVIHGLNDFLVGQCYADIDAKAMAQRYGVSTNPSSTGGFVDGAGSNDGDESLWNKNGKPVVSKVMVTGLAHAWPAGSGSSGGGSYIDHNSVNYPEYLTQYLCQNNRRAGGTCSVSGGGSGDGGSGDGGSGDGGSGDGGGSTNCWTTSNLNHKNAGRAISFGSNPWNTYYGRNTWSYMGLGDSTVTSLQENSPGAFTVVSSCP